MHPRDVRVPGVKWDTASKIGPRCGDHHPERQNIAVKTGDSNRRPPMTCRYPVLHSCRGAVGPPRLKELPLLQAAAPTVPKPSREAARRPWAANIWRTPRWESTGTRRNGPGAHNPNVRALSTVSCPSLPLRTRPVWPRQGGGHWFEPSIAHRRSACKSRGFGSRSVLRAFHNKVRSGRWRTLSVWSGPRLRRFMTRGVRHASSS